MTTRKKISELPDISELTIDDIFPMSDDPSGSPISKKASIQKIIDLLKKGYFARQVDNISDLSSEDAANGYICIVRDLDRGGIFKAVNSGTTNTGTIFASATVGWTWQRLFDGAVNIKWFGAIGDDSSNNNSAIQDAADFCNTNGRTLYIPSGTYKITDFINFYDLVIIGDGRDKSIIKSYATNKPVAVLKGSQSIVSGIGFHYDSIKSDKSCSNILISGVSGGDIGWFWSSLRDVGVLYGNFGIYTVGELSTTLSATASSGATSISVASVGSASLPSIVAGGFITITLNSGTQNIQVDSVSGTTVNLKSALNGDATSGNAVSVFETVFFSNSLDNIYCRFWNDYAIAHNGSGTGCKLDNIYMARGEANTHESCKGFMYLAGFNDGSFGQINCEWAEITSNAIALYGGDTMAIDSLHCEGIKFGAANLSYISTTMPSANVCAWTIDDWEVPSASTAAALVSVENTTTHSPSLKIDNLSIRDSKIESTNQVFYLNNKTGDNCYVYIDGYSPRKNAGIRSYGQLVTPSSASIGLRRFQPFFDDDIIGYTFKGNVSGPSDVFCYTSKNKASIEQILIGNSSISLSTAVAEVRTDTGGGGTAVLGSSALSDITGITTYFKSSNDAGIDNSILDFTSDGRFYLRVTTGQSGVAVSGTSASVQRFDDSSNGYGVNRITWGSAHGVSKGELVTISGATDTSFNGNYIVIDVTSTTIEFYKYTGSSVALTADTGISITRLPTVDLKLKGQDWGKPLFE